MARERVFSKLLGRGRRTGVQVYASQEPQPAGMMEDLDAAFGTATSPPKDKENNTTLDTNNNNNNSNKPRKELRFSLGTTASSDDSSLVSSTHLQGVLGKLKRRSSRGSLSPSELSKVSTAPPSPKEQVRRQEEEEEAMPPAPADDDEEEEDLTPPPDSPEALSLGQEAEEEVPTQGPDDHDLEQQDEIPTQGPDDVSDDDDDKEGTGFAVAASPEQPPLLQSPDTDEEEITVQTQKTQISPQVPRLGSNKSDSPQDEDQKAPCRLFSQGHSGWSPYLYGHSRHGHGYTSPGRTAPVP